MLNLKYFLFKVCFYSSFTLLAFNSSSILGLVDIGQASLEDKSLAREEERRGGEHHTPHAGGNHHYNHSGNQAKFQGGSHQNVHGGNTVNNLHGSGYHGEGRTGSVNVNPGGGNQNDQPVIILPDSDPFNTSNQN